MSTQRYYCPHGGSYYHVPVENVPAEAAYWCRAADVAKLEADHVSREKLKALVTRWRKRVDGFGDSVAPVVLEKAIDDLEALL